MSVLIVLVNDYDIKSQQSNVQHAITYAAKFSRTRYRIDWFLSGACRSGSLISEAQLMSETISTISESCVGINKLHWHYVHDNRSTNIKDNFARLNDWLEFNKSYTEIQIVTSNSVALTIAQSTIPGNKFKWIYSGLIEPDNIQAVIEPEKRLWVETAV